MKDKIKSFVEEISSFKSDDSGKIEAFRIKFLGKKGAVADLFNDFKSVAKEDRKEIGIALNDLKNKAKEKIENLKSSSLPDKKASDKKEDFTMPGYPNELGSRHPLSIVRKQIIDIFSRMGFTLSYGPEIEDDWHNFSALNFPEEHPARDMQDTFFIENKPGATPEEQIALRTHTSSVQVRVMENSEPPLRTISPGRVFRNEAISARAHCIFHQVEGLYINKDVSFADLKQTLLHFSREMFGADTKIRFRPSYFPFTEPSAEMDISCNICGGKGCNICKYSGWVEILGCGMIDPNVLGNNNIDSKKYTGFAFGMGIERITMLKYQIDDLRLFFENDARFLDQFKAAR
ncbi:MAG: phenylalanine--tRNA ligase subunit alpha [Flavobacteriales bacterium]|nr:phenylalanine--tRNA ligase subunit alpha [Flavobacteriales bacterium]